MLDFTREDYPPTEREMHQAEDEADLAPETAAYRNWARGTATWEATDGTGRRVVARGRRFQLRR